mmetsp:Transcript_29304/g.72486  ORF Transcript_29304/g.72486 Transcript_29304/m.72486 type:complete len:253 (+) Transcript_29304:1883-2641(+)
MRVEAGVRVEEVVGGAGGGGGARGGRAAAAAVRGRRHAALGRQRQRRATGRRAVLVRQLRLPLRRPRTGAGGRAPAGRPGGGGTGARARASHQERAVGGVSHGERGGERGGGGEDAGCREVEQHEAEARVRAELAQPQLEPHRATLGVVDRGRARDSECLGNHRRVKVWADQSHHALAGALKQLRRVRGPGVVRGRSVAEEHEGAARVLHHVVVGGRRRERSPNVRPGVNVVFPGNDHREERLPRASNGVPV